MNVVSTIYDLIHQRAVLWHSFCGLMSVEELQCFRLGGLLAVHGGAVIIGAQWTNRQKQVFLSGYEAECYHRVFVLGEQLYGYWHQRAKTAADLRQRLQQREQDDGR